MLKSLVAVVGPCAAGFALALAGCQIGNGRTAVAIPVPAMEGPADGTVAPDPTKLPTLAIAAADWAQWNATKATQLVCDLRTGTVDQGRVDLFLKHMTAAKIALPPEQVKIDAFPIPSTNIATASLSCDPKAPVFGLNGVGIKPDIVLWTGNGMDFDGPNNTNAQFDVFAASLATGTVIHAHFDLNRNPKDNSVTLTSADDIAVGNVKPYLPANVTGFLMTSSWAGELYFVAADSPASGLYTGVRFFGKNMQVANFVVQ